MKLKTKKRIGTTMSYIGISLVTIMMILPLVWLLSASLQTQTDIYRVPFRWIPREFHFENFPFAIRRGNLDEAMASSVCVSLIYMVCHLSFCPLIGYVFAKYDFRGKNLCFTLVLLTMMIPQELALFPIYGVIKKLHLIDTYLGVALPLIVSGMGVFMMRQFSMYIPNEVLEAAELDGCGNLQRYFHIALPMLKPGIASLSVLAFSYIWDEFAWSRLCLNSSDKMTLPIMLTNLISTSSMEVELMARLAGAVLAMVPVVVVFLIFQRQFVESVAISGVKG